MHVSQPERRENARELKKQTVFRGSQLIFDGVKP